MLLRIAHPRTVHQKLNYCASLSTQVVSRNFASIGFNCSYTTPRRLLNSVYRQKGSASKNYIKQSQCLHYIVQHHQKQPFTELSSKQKNYPQNFVQSIKTMASGDQIAATAKAVQDSLTITDTPTASETSEGKGKEPETRYQPRYIDVGINLTDRMYIGFYHGRKVHEMDREKVIERAKAAGCLKLMVTGSDLGCSQRAMKLAEEYPGLVFATVGIHPCHATDVKKNPEQLKEIEDLAIEGKKMGVVTAFGEIGLDYDRFSFADKDSQLRAFEKQLIIAHKVNLPMFLHSRAAEEDFNRLLFEANLPRKGLVHSFTGTLEEMKVLVEHGYDIGINGCSLKTEENLDVVREVPLERLQIETDGPWCEIRNTHASAKYLKTMPEYLWDSIPKEVKKERFQMGLRVKSRNEPCMIAGVAWVIAQVKGISFEEVCEASWANSMNMFRFDEAALRQEQWKKDNPPAAEGETET